MSGDYKIASSRGRISGNKAASAAGTLVLSLGALGLAQPVNAASETSENGPTPSTLRLAQASEATSPAKESDSGLLEEVVVTGSHIARSTFTTPNPVTVVDAQQMQNLGLTNVNAVLATLPQNSTLYSPASQPGSNFNTGASFANLRGLNPFFGTRTLTLVDGRRVVPTSTGGAVDLNVFPSMLVGRIETVTGGASAAYGSDAVAGVVNVILDTRLQGFKAQADFGQSSAGDGNGYHGSAAYGTSFAAEHGHVILGAEYDKMDSIGACARTAQSWCGTQAAQFSNPAYVFTGGPQYIVGANGKSTGTTVSGVLYSPSPFFPGAGAALGQFNDAGTTLSAFDPGQYGGPFSQTPRLGGDGVGVGVYDAVPLLPDVEHYSLFAHANYDLTDTMQGFLEGSYANRKSSTYQAQAGAQGTFIAPDNAFLAPGVAAQIPTGAYLYRSGNNLSPTLNSTDDDTWRVSAGLKGALFAGWGWDAYVQYGHHTTDSLIRNNQASVFFGLAADAVKTNPALPYDPVTNPAVCRSGVPGCAPLNLFGTDPGAINPKQNDAFAFAYRPLIDNIVNTQKVAAVNANGDLFGGWGAGPVRAAVGAEFRREEISDEHALETNAVFYYQQFANYGDPYTGTTRVVEGYAELNVPVLKDLPLAKNIELDAAIRRTQNKTEGTVDHSFNPSIAGGGFTTTSHTAEFNTWKLSGVWDMTDWLRVRATRSRDVRAPSFQQLFTQYAYPAGFPFFPTTNPNQGVGGATYYPAATLNANPNLDPEKADTTTAGLVFSPTDWVHGLQISADWYQIKLNGAIAELPSGAFGPLQAVVNNCITTGSHCDLINGGTFTQTSTAALASVDDPNLNLGVYTTRGVDLEVGYNTALSNLKEGLRGNLDLRLVTSYTYDMIIDTGGGGVPVNYAGQSGPAGGFSGSYNASPKLQSNAFVTYATGPFTGTVQVRYVGSGRFLTFDGINRIYTCSTATCAPGGINDNDVAGATYINLAASWKFGKALEVFGRLDNALDRDPPIDPTGSSATNAALFDTLGRTWRAGVRLAF